MCATRASERRSTSKQRLIRHPATQHLTEALPIMPTVVHGIPNCDSVKKARAWFEAQGMTCTFHDFKKLGVPAGALPAWCAAKGWQTVLNRKGTTWRQLDDAGRASVVDAASACDLMAIQPSLIKRPVVTWPDGELSVGWNETEFIARKAASA
jgi:Spx/MgsR family transcriptional regulator